MSSLRPYITPAFCYFYIDFPLLSSSVIEVADTEVLNVNSDEGHLPVEAL